MLLCCARWAHAQAVPPAPAEIFTPTQLRADLRFIQYAVASTHPDPGFSSDPAQLRQAYARIDAQLTAPMTRDQAWRLLATLNPVYADGHMALTQPDPGAQSTAHLQAGGGFFPFEVVVDDAGLLYIRAQLGGAATPLGGSRIAQINGVPAERLVAELLARCHGDSAAFRTNLLATRWPFLYWKMFGAPAQFDVTLADAAGTQLHLAAVAKMPANLTGRNDFDQQFRFEMLPGGAALLTVNTFYWPDKKQFTDFTARAFAQIRAADVKTLLIDVRENGGGNDDMWMDGILRYIADKPYRWASTYTKKVIKGRDSATEKLGEVINGTLTTWLQPQPDDTLHFSGTTYLLVGRSSYSSTILLSNVMQDFDFGKVVAATGAARARQSGGLQNLVLPNSGLALGVPRLILQRPSGLAEPMLLHPDIILPDSPYDRRALINAVLNL